MLPNGSIIPTDAVDEKSSQLIQTNLIVLGVIFATAGTALSKDWDIKTDIAVLLATLLTIGASTTATLSGIYAQSGDSMNNYFA